MLALSLPSTDPTAAPGGDLAAACFDAGAALALLGQAVTGEATHLGLWLDRLALRASAAILKLAGRREDEAAIRDAALLTRPGDDPGPAGRAFALWRRLVARTPSLTGTADLQQVLGLSSPAGIPDPALVSPDRPAPLAAAGAAITLHRHHPRQPGLALAVADLVLARSLDWPRTVPLLAAGLGRRLPNLEAPDWPVICAAAYARAAVQAGTLFGDLEQRARRLQSVEKRLRAKQATPVITALLSQDALSATMINDSVAPAMSDRAARRLLERLVGLGAARELTGRSTHRLYGL